MKINKILLIFAAAVLLAACSAKHKDAIVSVNGTEIAKSTYIGTVQNMASQYLKADPKFWDNPQNRQAVERAALEQIVTGEVLYQEAKKQKLTVDEALVKQQVNAVKNLFAFDKDGKPTQDKDLIEKNFKAKLAQDGITYEQFENNIRKELLAKAMTEKITAAQKAELQEEKLKQFYDDLTVILSKDQAKINALTKENLSVVLPFAKEVNKFTAERAQVSAVFLALPKNISQKDADAKQALAKNIVKALKENKISFNQAIQQYSDDKNALKTNGEQLVLKGALPADLDNKIFTAKLGEVTGPVKESDGIYIFRVNQKRAQSKPVYTELRTEIAKYLGTLQIKLKAAAAIRDLVSKADIKAVGEAAKKAPEQKQEQPQAQTQPQNK